jgi:hypothetical protein
MVSRWAASSVFCEDAVSEQLGGTKAAVRRQHPALQMCEMRRNIDGILLVVLILDDIFMPSADSGKSFEGLHGTEAAA